MTRFLAFLAIALSACAGDEESAPSAPSAEPDYYESSGTAYYIPNAKIDEVADAALGGDDEQLQRLIDFYQFSADQSAQNSTQLQRWLSLGAERGLKAARYNLLYLASESSGPSCKAVRSHLAMLPTEKRKTLVSANPYVAACRNDQ